MLKAHVQVDMTIPYFQKIKFIRVSSLVGRYFYDVYVYSKKFEIVFSLKFKYNNICRKYHTIRLSYSI